MIFKEHQALWRTKRYEGKKKLFKFSIATHDKGYYVNVVHATKDIRFNSLWENITFNTLNEAKEWCENFNYKNYICVGDDIKE